jgi:hypothetical protein
MNIKITEKKLESQILDWLNFQPKTFAFKVNTVGIFDREKNVFRKNLNPHVHRGTSDIIGVTDGRFFAIEVKLKGRKLNEFQTTFLVNVKRKGGVSLVAHSLDEVIGFMSIVMRAA